MLFQGYEIEENMLRENYERVKKIFKDLDMKLMSFDDWVEYNNNYEKEVKKEKRAKKNAKN